MKKRRERVSLDDIAKSLNVSRTLVSLVLNGRSEEFGIAEKTKQRVLAQAKALNYMPNQQARALRLGRSNTIGLIVSDISNPFYAHITRHLEDLADSMGYSLLTSSSDESPEKERHIIEMLKSRSVDGLIISTSQDSPQPFIDLKNMGFPVVLIDRYFEGQKLCSVTVNNFGGGQMAANHLLKMGFKSPIALAISPTYISTIHDRIEGYKSILEEAGLEAKVFDVEYAQRDKAVDTILESLHGTPQFPDSIFATNNALTISALQKLRNMGISVPNHMGFISFDDLDYFGIMHPSVTAVSQPINNICTKAFHMLTEQIGGKTLPLKSCSVKLPVKLMVRESTQNKIVQNRERKTSHPPKDTL